MDLSRDIEKIFKEYKGRIFGLALSITGNEKDAEDVLQNTIVKIIDNLRGFRNESSLSTWIYKIAYREALMNLRKKYRQSRPLDYLGKKGIESSPALFVNWSKLPDEELLDKEFRERIDKAIKGLPIKYRMALLLHNFNDFSLKDTGAVLRLKDNSVKTRVHRGLLMIKDEISDYLRDKDGKEGRKGKKCGNVTGFVFNYVSGKLNRLNRRAFDRHIRDCSGCKDFFDSYAGAIRITRALECRDIPSDLQKKIETFLFSGHLNSDNEKGGKR